MRNSPGAAVPPPSTIAGPWRWPSPGRIRRQPPRTPSGGIRRPPPAGRLRRFCLLQRDPPRRIWIRVGVLHHRRTRSTPDIYLAAPASSSSPGLYPPAVGASAGRADPPSAHLLPGGDLPPADLLLPRQDSLPADQLCRLGSQRVPFFRELHRHPSASHIRPPPCLTLQVGDPPRAPAASCAAPSSSAASTVLRRPRLLYARHLRPWFLALQLGYLDIGTKGYHPHELLAGFLSSRSIRTTPTL